MEIMIVLRGQDAKGNLSQEPLHSSRGALTSEGKPALTISKTEDSRYREEISASVRAQGWTEEMSLFIYLSRGGGVVALSAGLASIPSAWRAAREALPRNLSLD